MFEKIFLRTFHCEANRLVAYLNMVEIMNLAEVVGKADDFTELNQVQNLPNNIKPHLLGKKQKEAYFEQKRKEEEEKRKLKEA